MIQDYPLTGSVSSPGVNPTIYPPPFRVHCREAKYSQTFSQETWIYVGLQEYTGRQETKEIIHSNQS
jgi:hypothetical protein